MPSMPNILKKEVVRSENVLEAMASGILGSTATTIVHSMIPKSIPYAGIATNIIQIGAGAFIGKAVSGTVGRVLQNALVYGAASSIGIGLAGALLGRAGAAEEEEDAEVW